MWSVTKIFLKFTLTNISCLNGRKNRTMREWTNFVLWSPSWEIDSPHKDGQDGLRLSSVAPILVTYSWHIDLFLVRDHLPKCENCWCILPVCHISVRCPHLQVQPVRDDVFGNEGVKESFQFQSWLNSKFFWETGSYQKLFSHFKLEKSFTFDFKVQVWMTVFHATGSFELWWRHQSERWMGHEWGWK